MMGILEEGCQYFSSNGYIKTSVQKAGVLGFPGCVEHSVVTELTIQLTESTRKDLSVIWLKLANTYGGIPHSLIKYSLHFFCVPEKLQSYYLQYYETNFIRFTARNFTTGWQRPERRRNPHGISPIALEIIVRSAREFGREVENKTNQILSPIYVFMDDLILLNPSTEESQCILEKLE